MTRPTSANTLRRLLACQLDTLTRLEQLLESLPRSVREDEDAWGVVEPPGVALSRTAPRRFSAVELCGRGRELGYSDYVPLRAGGNLW